MQPKTDFEKWMELSKPTVEFLQNVFREDYVGQAKIMTMQAEQDADGLCKALDSVVEFCQRRKNELRNDN